jgi:hypothetical protein
MSVAVAAPKVQGSAPLDPSRQHAPAPALIATLKTAGAYRANPSPTSLVAGILPATNPFCGAEVLAVYTFG